MLYQSREDLLASLEGIIRLGSEEVTVLHGEQLRRQLIDTLVYNALFNTDLRIREVSKWVVHAAALYLGAVPSSIQNLYQARSQEDYTSKTLLALNIRGLTYDTARAVFRTLKTLDCTATLFEYGVDEAAITDQSPSEFVCCVLAAAIKESYSGPVFLQAGRFRFNGKNYLKNATEERTTVRNHIKELIDSGFYNIDVDTSRLVQSSRQTLAEKLRDCFEELANMTAYIRELQPKEIVVAMGGRTTVLEGTQTIEEELEVLLDGYFTSLKRQGVHLDGIVKVGIHAGITEGSRPLPDGRVVHVQADAKTIETLNDLAIRQYRLGGVVLHEISTLTEQSLKQLPTMQVLEAHATSNLQDCILDSPHLPEELRQEIHGYLKDSHRALWREGITEEQFLYATRKACFGPFKKKFWDLDSDVKAALIEKLQEKITALLHTFALAETKALVREFVQPVVLPREKPPFLA